MARLIGFLYGLLCYVGFFGVFLYLIGFTGNLVVPKTVDAGTGSFGLPAWLGNLLLIALFGIQHSIMARPTFKKAWTRIIPKPLERSTFVLATVLVLVVLYRYWQPMPGVIWNFSGAASAALWALFVFGWVTVLTSSCLINHFDLFGLRQVWLYFQGKDYAPIPFKVSGFYKYIRNPLMFGFLIAFWAAPIMTAGHLLFAAGFTVYIFIGMFLEERNIAEALGEPYVKYKAQTSMIIPGLRARAIK